MARVTAVSLRDRVRSALIAAGGRGFVRFPECGALLVSDAVRRCESDADRKKLTDALSRAGFDASEQDDLLMINPKDELLQAIAYEGAFSVNWDGVLSDVQALAMRWLGREKQPLTQEGRQLVIDALRFTWQDRMTDGLEALRAHAAVMQRQGDTSGFLQAGIILADWCDRQEGRCHED